MTGKASTALVEGLVNNTAMPTILNISAYKFVALDQLPTLQEQLLAAALRRGYTPEGFCRFAEMIGVSKSDGWIDYSCWKSAFAII